MSEKETLAACPFCGGEPVMRTVLEHPGEWAVEWLICCHDCGIQMSHEYREDACEAWNRRADLAPQLSPDAPPYVLRGPGGYRDATADDDCPEGWTLYVRTDLPRPGAVTEAARDCVIAAAKEALAADDAFHAPAFDGMECGLWRKRDATFGALRAALAHTEAPNLSPRGVQPFDGIPTATSEIARLMDLSASQSREVAALSARLAEAERRAEEAEALLREIIGAGLETRHGLMDCIDNRGSAYQSAYLHERIEKATPAEVERLAMLTEEAAEVIQIVGKILRHGYASYHPDDLTPVADGGKITKMPRMGALDNRALLMNELADFNAVQLLMEGSGDVFRTGDEIEHAMARKLTYTHHQEPR